MDVHHLQLNGGCLWCSDVGLMFIIHNCIADVMIYGRRGRCSQFTGVWWVPVSYGWMVDVDSSHLCGRFHDFWK